MLRILTLVLTSLVLAVPATAGAETEIPSADTWTPQAFDVAAPGYRRGAVLLQLEPDAGDALVKALGAGVEFAELPLPPGMRSLNARYGARGIAPLFDPERTSEEHFARVQKKFPKRAAAALPRPEGDLGPRLHHVFELEVGWQLEIPKVARAYQALDEVTFAEPDVVLELYSADTFWNLQWAMTNVNATLAWGQSTGAGQVIAIIDTGLSAHPDLIPNRWVNTGETPNNNQDDDGNGYVDDVYGWDFANGDPDPDEVYGHGTAVAGPAAAKTNNNLGIAGMAHDARIMVPKALSDFPWPTLNFAATAAEAIQYAVDNGAHVINNSYGFPAGANTNLREFSHLSTIKLLVDYAYANGVVVVNAAGNSPNSNTCLFHPTGVETGISVGAAQANLTASPFSSFGVKLDVAAPGGFNTQVANLSLGADVLTTLDLPSITGQAVQNGNAAVIQTGIQNDTYAPLSGTSIAAPHVAGLAAMLRAKYPAWNLEEIRQAIRQTTTTWQPGGAFFDVTRGFGHIDAFAALSLPATPLPTAALMEPANCEWTRDSVDLVGHTLRPSGTGHYEVWIAPGANPTIGQFNQIAGPIPLDVNGTLHTLNTNNFADGDYVLRVVTKDTTNGTESEDRNQIRIQNAYIADPLHHSTLSSLAPYPVMGKTGTANYSYYELEERPLGTNTWTPVGGTTAGPFANVGQLGLWSGFTDGCYELRLTVHHTGNMGPSYDYVVVCVDSGLLSGWPVDVNHDPTMKSPKIADLDGDGSKEIIYGASVFEADGTLKSGFTLDPGIGRTNPAISDVDGLGGREVVAIVHDYDPNGPNAGAPVVRALEPNGNALWTYAVQNPNTTGLLSQGTPSSVAIGDVDGDGRDEVVFTVFFLHDNPNLETILFILDAATGLLETSTALPGIGMGSPTLADLDRDGMDDIVLTLSTTLIWNWLIGLGEVHVVTLNALSPLNLNWPQPAQDLHHANGMPEAVVGDIDRDGDLEILAGHRMWHHDGTPVSGWPLPDIASGTGAMVPGEDGDCELEIVVSPGSQDQQTNQAPHHAFHVHEHTGAHVYTHLMTNGEGGTGMNLVWENPVPGSPIVADIDGDGRSDIVRGAVREQLGAIRSALYAIGSNGAQGFPKYLWGESDYLRSTPAIDDVDGDGDADLAMAAGGKIYVWDLGIPWAPHLAPWPTFQADLRNTGTLDPLDAAGLTAGGFQSYAVKRDHGLRATGRNEFGQLGDGNSPNSAFVPVDLGPAACNVNRVSSHLHHALGLRNDGTVVAFGNDNHGQLGDLSPGGFDDTPAVVLGLADIVMVAAGGEHSIALGNDGSVYTWGNNGGGQLGQGTFGATPTSHVPTLLAGSANSGTRAVAAGESFSMGLHQGAVWTFGRNAEGQLGDGTTTNSASPVQAVGLSNVVAIAGGGLHALALTEAGDVYAWGANDHGQLGQGTFTPGPFNPGSTVPIQVPGLADIVAIAAGQHHSVALAADGTVYTWGFNDSGQLGINTTLDVPTPTAVPGLPRIREISAGYKHTLALPEGSEAPQVWGHNFSGAFGDGSNLGSLVPTPSGL